jgi:hypothetical protein
MMTEICLRKNPYEFKIKISRTSVLYGISENGNQNLEEYLKNKLQVQDKNTTLVEQKNKK